MGNAYLSFHAFNRFVFFLAIAAVPFTTRLRFEANTCEMKPFKPTLFIYAWMPHIVHNMSQETNGEGWRGVPQCYHMQPFHHMILSDMYNIMVQMDPRRHQIQLVHSSYYIKMTTLSYIHTTFNDTIVTRCD